MRQSGRHHAERHRAGFRHQNVARNDEIGQLPVDAIGVGLLPTALLSPFRESQFVRFQQYRQAVDEIGHFNFVEDDIADLHLMQPDDDQLVLQYLR